VPVVDKAEKKMSLPVESKCNSEPKFFGIIVMIRIVEKGFAVMSFEGLPDLSVHDVSHVSWLDLSVSPFVAQDFHTVSIQ
jgi:hypothetical protein